MRWKAAVAGLGLVLVTGTACAGPPVTGSPQPGVPASPTSSAVPPSLVPLPPGTGGPATPGGNPSSPAQPPIGNPAMEAPDGSEPVPASQLDLSRLPAGWPHDVWVSRDGMVVSVKAEEGGCLHATVQPAEQSASRVVFDVRRTRTQTMQQMCSMMIRYTVISAPLQQPLGDRTVVLRVQPVAR